MFYSTPDPAIAAWLHYKGFSISDIKLNGKFHTFIFNDSSELQNCLRLWNLGSAEGNCRLYENARANIFRMIKSSKQALLSNGGGDGQA